MRTIDDVKKVTIDKDSTTDKKRTEILKLAEDAEIDQSIKYIKKALSKVIDKIYKEYEDKKISIDSCLYIGGLGAIESVEVLEDELLKDKILKADVERIISCVTLISHV